jgi:hypothetical protein
MSSGCGVGHLALVGTLRRVVRTGCAASCGGAGGLWNRRILVRCLGECAKLLLSTLSRRTLMAARSAISKSLIVRPSLDCLGYTCRLETHTDKVTLLSASSDVDAAFRTELVRLFHGIRWRNRQGRLLLRTVTEASSLAKSSINLRSAPIAWHVFLNASHVSIAIMRLLARDRTTGTISEL